MQKLLQIEKYYAAYQITQAYYEEKLDALLFIDYFSSLRIDVKLLFKQRREHTGVMFVQLQVLDF